MKAESSCPPKGYSPERKIPRKKKEKDAIPIFLMCVYLHVKFFISL